MNKVFSTAAGILFLALLATNCSQEADYESMVQEGLNSGIENNELFLRYELGMTRDDFFAVSWEMNRDEIISGLVKIDYEFEGLKSRALMRFYPDFVDDRISNVPVDVQYLGWAPWNSDLSSDSLVVDLVSYYEEDLNASFKYVYVPHLDKNAYVSVQGNRAVKIYPLTDMVARLEFTDLKAHQRN